MRASSRVPETQLVYARTLHWVSIMGFVLLAGGYFVYMARLLPTTIPAVQIASSWHLSSAEFMKRVDIPAGWSWVGSLGYGDILSFASIIFLAIGSIFCLVSALPSLIRERSIVYPAIVTLQILVLLLAASGILQGGGH